MLQPYASQIFSQAFFNGPVITLLATPLVLILLDILTGVLSAVKQGVFEWKRVADFMGNDLLKYIGLFFMILLIWLKDGSVQATTLSTASGMGILSVSIFGSIWQNLGELFPKEVSGPPPGLPSNFFPASVSQPQTFTPNPSSGSTFSVPFQVSYPSSNIPNANGGGNTFLNSAPTISTPSIPVPVDMLNTQSVPAVLPPPLTNPATGPMPQGL